jgi:hypothetical protein
MPLSSDVMRRTNGGDARMSPPYIMMSADSSQMLIFGMPTYGMRSAKENYFAS